MRKNVEQLVTRHTSFVSECNRRTHPSSKAREWRHESKNKCAAASDNERTASKPGNVADGDVNACDVNEEEDGLVAETLVAATVHALAGDSVRDDTAPTTAAADAVAVAGALLAITIAGVAGAKNRTVQAT